MAQQYVKAVELTRSIGTTAEEILPVNPQRSYALLMNDSDTAIYISLGGTAVANQGIRINANGGAYEISAVNLYRGRISAICSVASKTLLTVEW